MLRRQPPGESRRRRRQDLVRFHEVLLNMQGGQLLLRQSNLITFQILQSRRLRSAMWVQPVYTTRQTTQV